MTGRKIRALIIGKFKPFHIGHEALIDYAIEFLTEKSEDEIRLDVLVCARDDLMASQRFYAVRNFCLDRQRLAVSNFESKLEIKVAGTWTAKLPDLPEHDPEFWNKWTREIYGAFTLDRCNIAPIKYDYVFAGEPYGKALAENLDGAKFIPFPDYRKILPVSGTGIRDDMFKNQQFISKYAYPHFGYDFCIFGPESTGKTTMVKRLAQELHGMPLPEYARTYLEAHGPDYERHMLNDIVEGNIATKRWAKKNNLLRIHDTDILTTKIWHEYLVGGPTMTTVEEDNLFRDYFRYVYQIVENYDMTFVIDSNHLPFTPDPMRYGGDKRQLNTRDFTKVLDDAGRDYVVVEEGSFEANYTFVKNAIKEYADRNNWIKL